MHFTIKKRKKMMNQTKKKKNIKYDDKETKKSIKTGFALCLEERQQLKSKKRKQKQKSIFTN